MTITIISIILVILLIIGTFIYAKRRELTCSKCGSQKIKKTGNKKDVARSKRAIIAGPVPYYEHEYECLNCNHHFWSTIESIWSP